MPGPRVGLTRERVLRAAVDLVDREGLSRLSMRRLGSDLGVEAMTLYHYVSDKDELLDGMVGLVVADAVPALQPRTRWRAALRGYGTGLRAALRERPRIVPLVMARPAVTPAMLDIIESILELLQRSGFTVAQGWSLVRGITLLAVGSVTDPADPLADDSPSADATSHPLAFAAFAEAAGRSDALFELTLDRLLDGYDGVRQDRRSGTSAASRS